MHDLPDTEGNIHLLTLFKVCRSASGQVYVIVNKNAPIDADMVDAACQAWTTIHDLELKHYVEANKKKQAEREAEARRSLQRDSRERVLVHLRTPARLRGPGTNSGSEAPAKDRTPKSPGGSTAPQAEEVEATEAMHPDGGDVE